MSEDIDPERKFSNGRDWDNSIDWDDASDGSDGGYNIHGSPINPEAMKELVQLRMEVARLREAQKWLSMDLAPEDGTVILAVVDVYSSTTKKFLRSDIHLVGRDAHGDAVTLEGDDVGWAWEDFKCWKPIVFPPAPADQEGEKNEN
jgi:hypothetical protein